LQFETLSEEATLDL